MNQKKHVKIVYLPIERDGWCDVTRNLIVVNSLLTQEEQEKVILHELGHLIKHNNKVAHYNVCGANLIQMEGEADRYMVKELIERLSQKYDLDPSNWQNFMTVYHIESYLEPMVREEFAKYETD